MNHMSELLRAALRPRPVTSVLDTANKEDQGIVLDGADDYTARDIRLSAIAAVQEWAETDDLDEGETSADRLLALMVGIADANKDGDIDEDEQGVLEIALNAAWDYLLKLGVDDDDLDALFNEWDEDVAGRVRELAASELPDGEDAAGEDMDSFVFANEDDQEPVFDAVYKKKLVIRKGKKVRIRKRVSGRVRLSAKQKMAIRKARRKSHSAGAMMRRMKSMRLRRKAGL